MEMKTNLLNFKIVYVPLLKMKNQPYTDLMYLRHFYNHVFHATTGPDTLQRSLLRISTRVPHLRLPWTV